MSLRSIDSIRLIIGGDERNTWEIREGEELTIGRDPGCTIQINHSSISPIHCTVSFERGVLLVKDLDSREGIYHEAVKRRKIDLKEDGEFALGQIPIATRRGEAVAPYSEVLRPQKKVALEFEKEHGIKPPVPLKEKEEVPAIVRVRRALRKIPFLGLSLVVHLIILLLIYDFPYFTRKLFTSQQIQADVLPPEEDTLVYEDFPDEKEFEEPELPDEEPLDPLEDLLDMEEEPPLEEERIPQDIFITSLESGRGKVIGLGGEGFANLSGKGLSNGFKKYITGLRSAGMDVAFVMDTTSSMSPFLDEAKRVVDKLISKLAAVVPKLRLSILTYRDRGDEYITRHLDLSSDRYEILNFLEECEAAGGGDFPEAICEALNRAINTLDWLPGAKKVIIVIGDAPFHKQDCPEIDRLLKGFCKGDNPGVVNTVYIGPITDPPGPNQKAAVECMKHIAFTAGGEFSWISEREKMTRHLVNTAFGFQWEGDVSRLLGAVKQDRMARLIERKAKTNKKDWLLDGIKKPPVRAGIVKALIATADPEDLEILAGYLTKEYLPVESRRAALYVLRKVLDECLEFDPNMDVGKQNKELLVIRKAISEHAAEIGYKKKGAPPE